MPPFFSWETMLGGQSFVLLVHAGHDAATQRAALEGTTEEEEEAVLTVDARLRRAWPLLSALDIPLDALPRAWRVRAPLEEWLSRPRRTHKRAVVPGDAAASRASSSTSLASLVSSRSTSTAVEEEEEEEDASPGGNDEDDATSVGGGDGEDDAEREDDDHSDKRSAANALG